MLLMTDKFYDFEEVKHKGVVVCPDNNKIVIPSTEGQGRIVGCQERVFGHGTYWEHTHYFLVVDDL